MINLYKLNKINMNREREEITTLQIDSVKQFILNLPLTKLELPVVYPTDELQIIDYSCIVKDKNDKILTVIIYDKDDSAIKDIIDINGEILLDKMPQFLPPKRACFYGGFSNATKPKNYGGVNWLEGYQRYMHPIKKKQEIKYHKRKDADSIYIKSLLEVYCGIYEMEKRYLPEAAAIRLSLSKMSPYSKNCPIELNPSTTLGGSFNFNNKPHADSCVKGLPESIIFKQRSDIPYIFKNDAANIEFKILGCCMIFQDGKTLHHTKDTGNHLGIGFVNITKSNLVNKTEYTDELFRKI